MSQKLEVLDLKVNEIFNEELNEKKIQRHLTVIKKHHNETYEHLLRVCVLCIRLGYENNLPEKDVRILGYSGLLHDIGKIDISSRILSKKSKINDGEKLKIKKHAREGFERLRGTEYTEVGKIIVAHHEFMNKPYPRNSQKPNKPSMKNERRHTNPYLLFLAQILAIADMYDALSNKRTYKEALTKDCIRNTLDKEFIGNKKFIEQVMKINKK